MTLEEGTWAAWLHDLLKPHVMRVLVSDPRKNDLGRDGSRNDRRDARELAELLYRDQVKSVYHGEHTDTTSLSHQASVVGVHRSDPEDPHQW